MNQQLEINSEPQNNPVQNEVKEQISNQPIEQKENSKELKIETDKEINWRRFREQREIERKQKLEAERIAVEERAKADALKSAMDALLNKPNNSNEYQNSYNSDLSEEDRIEKKVQEVISKREVEYEKHRLEREKQEFPAKLNQTYSDFNQVCSTENLDYLEYHYPELASPFKHMPDGFEKWSSIYKAVKRLVPNPDSKKDSQKADKNFQKPQSISSPSSSQGGLSTGPKILDEQRKAENWKRMQKAIRDLT